MDQYMTSADVARRVGLTPAAIRAAAASGRLPVAGVTEGGVRLFRRFDVERFRAEREASTLGARPSTDAA